jgi:hypothetical protein
MLAPLHYSFSFSLSLLVGLADFALLAAIYYPADHSQHKSVKGVEFLASLNLNWTIGF